MSFQPFSSKHSLIHALKDRPELAGPLLDLSEAVMRGPGPLEPMVREILFTYASALNGCNFCRESHAVALEAFGFGRDDLDKLIKSGEPPDFCAHVRPLMEYAERLIRDPDSVDADAARSLKGGGFDDAVLAQVSWVCALARCYNTLVAGLGIAADPALTRFGGEQIHRQGYAHFKSAL